MISAEREAPCAFPLAIYLLVFNTINGIGISGFDGTEADGHHGCE
jgi:hypothetical protein